MDQTVEQSRIWDLKGCKYARMLAKIHASAIFHMQDICGNDLPKFLELCLIKMPCWCPSGRALTLPPHTNRNICR